MLNLIASVLEAVALVIALLAGFFFITMMPLASGAPQEASIAAASLCAAAIPYILASLLHHYAVRQALIKAANRQS